MTNSMYLSVRKVDWSRWTWLPQLVIWCLLGMVLVRTAWVCDDAFITFRTVDNILDGYGATWNPDERVQAYTHPLWMLLHLPLQALFRNIYAVTLILSLVLSLVTMYLLARSFQFYWMGMVAILIAISSKAFIEFSTSGLENPLSHLLLVLFVLQCGSIVEKAGKFGPYRCLSHCCCFAGWTTGCWWDPHLLSRYGGSVLGMLSAPFL